MLRLCSCVHSLCLLNSPPTPCELLLINKFGNFILFYFCFICFIYHFLIFYFFIMCVVCCYCWRAVWCCALLPIIINRVLFRRRATFQVRYFLITSATSHRIHPYLTTSQIKVVEYACQLHYYQPDVWFTLFVYLVCTLMTGCVTVLVVWGYDLNVCMNVGIRDFCFWSLCELGTRCFGRAVMGLAPHDVIKFYVFTHTSSLESWTLVAYCLKEAGVVVVILECRQLSKRASWLCSAFFIFTG